MNYLKPRQGLLLGVVLVLAAWNVWRYEHQRKATQAAFVADVASVGNDVWAAFDRAARLRDAPEEQFAPALAAVKTAEGAVPNPNLLVNANMLADVRGCLTWLEFYRGHKDAAWHERSQQHLDACVRDHRDESN